MLDNPSPLTYSAIDKGEAKIFKKLRDHTFSKKAVVTSCITREKKSQSRTAPRNTGTRSNLAPITVLKYLVMNPHSTISMHTQANSGTMRAGLPRIRYMWRRTIAEIRREFMSPSHLFQGERFTCNGNEQFFQRALAVFDRQQFGIAFQENPAARHRSEER